MTIGCFDVSFFLVPNPGRYKVTQFPKSRCTQPWRRAFQRILKSSTIITLLLNLSKRILGTIQCPYTVNNANTWMCSNNPCKPAFPVFVASVLLQPLASVGQSTCRNTWSKSRAALQVTFKKNLVFKVSWELQLPRKTNKRYCPQLKCTPELDLKFPSAFQRSVFKTLGCIINQDITLYIYVLG